MLLSATRPFSEAFNILGWLAPSLIDIYCRFPHAKQPAAATTKSAASAKTVAQPAAAVATLAAAVTAAADTQAPTITQWQSALDHQRGVGEAALTIPDDDLFCEGRQGGFRRLLIDFNEPIAPASFTPAGVKLSGFNISGPMSFTGLTVTTSLRNGNTTGVITFASSLPDSARYRIQVIGVTDVAGNLLQGDNDRVLTSLTGDVSGDRRVNAVDLSRVRASTADPISTANSDQVRSDVDLDGRVNAIDLSRVRANQDRDARGISIPPYAFNRTIWVDDDGPATGADGSFAKPYRTITAAIAVAAPGNGIVTRAGTYRESVNINKSGSAGLPITVMGMPGERAIVSGFQTISGWQAYDASGTYVTTLNWMPKDLFVNFDRQRISQDPNGSWRTITGVSGTVITDSAGLVNYPYNVVGGSAQILMAASNTISSFPITAQDTTAGTLTLTGLAGVAVGDKYIVKNQVELIDRPGEWAIEDQGNGTWKMYFRPASAADLALTQSPNRASRIILVNAMHDVKIDGLEIAGSTGMGVEVRSNSSNIEVVNCIVHDNSGTGVSFRQVTNSRAARNLIFQNYSGLSVASGTGIVFEENEVAYNIADGVIVAGDVSGTGANGPTSNVIVRRNYIHHHLLWAHPDNMQMYRGVSDVHLIDNLVVGAGQGLMTEEVNGGELSGNVFLGSDAYLLIFGHSNSLNWSVHNNTVGYSGYGVYSFTATGYDVRENITLGTVNMGSVTGNQYTGDYNLYWTGNSADVILTTSSPKWTNYTTPAAFYAAQGQELHSQKADPLLTNTPIAFKAAERLLEATTTSLYLRKGTSGFKVGDHIELNFDGVVRTITAVDSSKITFDVALAALPLRETIVANWGTKTNYALDIRPTAASIANTMGPTGGQIGSKVNSLAYVAGDFTGDGVRDIPALPAGVKFPDPNNPVQPSF